MMFADIPATFAQQAVVAELTPAQTQMTVGDLVTLNLSVTHPAGWRVIVPELDRVWGDYEVVSQGTPQISANPDGTETTTQPINVTLFRVGAFETPTLSITVVDPNGTTTPIPVPPTSLNVVSVLTGSDTTLRDIKPQATLDVPGLSPLVVGGVALAAVLAAAAANLIARALRKPKPVIDNRTPVQRAKDDLTEIERSAWLANGEHKEYYDAISDTVRRYMEAVFGITAMGQTTSELRFALRQAGVPGETVRLAVDLLAECDVIKFATVTPTPQHAAVVLNRAREFIFLTEPVGQPPAAAKVKGAA